MIVNSTSLRDLFAGFNVSFNKGLLSAKSYWQTVAMKVPSAAAEENYSWLTGMPSIREWLGSRIVKELEAARYTVPNKDFEMTISVLRNKIEDDQYGIYGSMFEKMGYETALHPDDLVFGLLAKGATTKCYDDQYFFDVDHAGYNKAGEKVVVSNYTAGEGTPWYLLDCSQPIKPLVFQERKPFDFKNLGPDSEHAFWQKEYIYGVDGRSNSGYGLWQLAYGSAADLTVANFVAARTALASQRKPSGKPLGVRATHLVVPDSLEEAARAILNAELINGGESNVWAGSCELIVTPFVD